MANMSKRDETLNNLHQSMITSVKEALETCDQADMDRESANAVKAEARAKLKAKGIKPKAFDMARTVANMDPEDREVFFSSLQICLKAADAEITPIQMDLFVPDEDGDEDGDED